MTVSAVEVSVNIPIFSQLAWDPCRRSCQLPRLAAGVRSTEAVVVDVEDKLVPYGTSFWSCFVYIFLGWLF